MATALVEPRRDARPDSSSRHSPDLAELGRRVAAWLVGAAAVVVAVWLAIGFSRNARDLWLHLSHDRSAHYEYGVNLAMDVRHGNVAGLLHHLDGARVWGPLHGIVLAPIELIAGPDYRFAILPSMLAWVAAAVLAFVLTRRLLPEGGTPAGLLAAALFLVSPAHRAFATDIMLESSGAALTLWCLHRYLVAVQDDTRARGRWLGLALTVLFLTKSNYWLILVLGLAVGETIRQPRWCADALRRLAGPALSGRWLMAQVRNPWNCPIAALLGLAVFIVVSGGTTLHVGGMRISLSTAHNVIHLAFLLMFVRAVLWWRREKIAATLAASTPIVLELARWHAWPVAAYFLLPKRLGYFLWFVSPANGAAAEKSDLGRGAAFYATAIGQDYHVFAWALPALLLCAVIGCFWVRAWRPGSATLFCFLALAALATCKHPLLKNRHVHSWVALLWILAAAGLVHAVYVLLRGRPGVRRGIVMALALAVVAGHGSAWLDPGHAQEAGPQARGASILAIPETYLPALADARQPTILSSVHCPFFLSWTYQESQRRPRVDTSIKGYGSDAADLKALAAWATSTRSDALVLIDVAKDSPFFCDTGSNEDVAAIARFLSEGSTPFRRTAEWHLPDKVHITLWRRQAE